MEWDEVLTWLSTKTWMLGSLECFSLILRLPRSGMQPL